MNMVDFGFPGVLDNARKKEVVLYDTQTGATGQTVYPFFRSSSLAAGTRNKSLPPSGQEIIEIIGISFQPLTFNLVSAYTEIYSLSFLQITVNDVVKLKVPLIEILNGSILQQIGNTTLLYGNNRLQRYKRLEYPITLNSNCNVDIRVVTTTGGATALNSVLMRLELTALKTDKLENFNYDIVKNNKYEINSFTMYDNAVLQNSGSYRFFADRNKSDNLFSKIFPLAEEEAFVVKALEVFLTKNTVAATSFDSVYSLYSKSEMKININDVEFFNSNIRSFLSFIYHGAGTFDDAGPVNTNFNWVNQIMSGYVLNTPILIPSKSNVDVTLTQPDTVSVIGTYYITMMLKGDLIRRVQ